MSGKRAIQIERQNVFRHSDEQTIAIAMATRDTATNDHG